MKHRVIFNLTTHYLSITTSDISDSNFVELFSSQTNFDTPHNNYLCLNMCKVFCLGYLQGNDKIKAKNLPADFE